MNKQAKSFQNCFSFLFHLRQGINYKTFSHLERLRGRDKTASRQTRWPRITGCADPVLEVLRKVKTCYTFTRRKESTWQIFYQDEGIQDDISAYSFFLFFLFFFLFLFVAFSDVPKSAQISYPLSRH
jgi:hypothetical protein